MDGQTYWQMDRRTDGQTDGRAESVPKYASGSIAKKKGINKNEIDIKLRNAFTKPSTVDPSLSESSPTVIETKQILNLVLKNDKAK